MRLCKRWLVSLLLLLASTAPARSQPGRSATTPARGRQPEEDLATLVARRIQQASGVPVRIRELLYEVFTSTFRGRGIEIGPVKRPFLAIPRLDVELALLAGGAGTTIAVLEARGPRLRMLGRWVGGIYRYPVRQPARVRLARVSGGTVTLEAGGGIIRLDGVDVTVKGLQVPSTRAGEPPALSGALSVRASGVRVGSLALGSLELEGRLARKQLEVERLSLDLPGGKVTLGGAIGFGDNRRGPGPVALGGPFRAGFADSGALSGTLRLGGRSLSRLTLRGVVNGPGLPRRGGLEAAPPLALQLRVGKRRLRGTLRSWRLR